MSAAFFDKVLVKSNNDLAKLEQLMNQAVEQYMEKSGEGNNAEVREALKSLSANALTQMQFFIACGNDEDVTPGGGMKSPLLKPLSPPPVDAEVKQLEQEVEEASKRVAELRSNMQAVLSDKLAAKLGECRPTAEVTPPEPTAAPEQLPFNSPMAEELQQKLDETAAKLPELRARLEQATDRLSRVVQAVTEDDDKPPNTIERVILGKTPGPSAKNAEDLPVQQALESGLVSTRARRGGETDLAPVPYSLAEGEEGEEEAGAVAGVVDEMVEAAAAEEEPVEAADAV